MVLGTSKPWVAGSNPAGRAIDKSNSYLTFLIINNLATGVVTGAVLFPSNKTLKSNAEMFVIQ